MSDNLILVFSTPPAGVSPAEFSNWYDVHVRELAAVDGFAGARRYQMATIKGDWVPSGEHHLAVYETDGSPADALRAVGERAASGQLTLPGWFPQVEFATFACYLHGDHAGARLADHLYLVFAAPPEGLGNDEFVAWYQEHADENTQVPGFLANWRFRLEPEVIDASSPTVATHLAVYEVERDLATLRANLEAARVTNEARWPSWFDPAPWTSLDAIAIGDSVSAPSGTSA
jgi:hypothetical protein